MKKKKFSLLKKIILLFFGIILVCVITAFSLFVFETKEAKLDTSLFASSKNSVSFSICDKNGESVDSLFLFGEKSLDITTLPDHVKQAFIAVEDKRFYSHHGIDVKRIVGATMRNIKSGKFSEGASTITQQLIKNTHLSREKTIKRKMKEIKLAIQAEKFFDKDQILQEYLGTIYFGNGAYGIENASNLYFSKSASELDMSESALLAGIINAPTFYDPILFPERCEKRRNLVLSLMEKQGYISEDEYQKNAKKTINVVKNDIKTLKTAKKCIISEVCEKLKISENQLKNMKIKIKCNIDLKLQQEIDEMLSSGDFDAFGTNNMPATIGVVILENETKSVVAVSGVHGFSLSEKHQPGSIIKPIIVYAPAIEDGQIYPETIIKDEPISIDGYSPSNASKTYSGNVSVKEALERSLNIPAVKILSNLGVSKGKKFATNLGFDFDKNDNNLALALGGMTNGVSLKQIADAYSTFATDGNFCKSCFVSEIVSENGEVLFSSQKDLKKVMKSSTAFIVSDMLKGVVENGTAKRLSGFDFDVSAKTGTVGIQSSKLNSSAYTVCYTSEHTIAVFFGENSKSGPLASNVNGASYPAVLAKEILEKVYENETPKNFTKPESVLSLDVDIRGFGNGDVLLASPCVPDRYRKSSLFDKDNVPKSLNEKQIFKTTLDVKMEENQKPILTFNTKNGCKFLLVRRCGKSEDLLCEIVGNDEKFSFEDKGTETGKIYEYFVLTKSEYSENSQIQVSNKIKLMSY